jgi:hypothetical protein
METPMNDAFSTLTHKLQTPNCEKTPNSKSKKAWNVKNGGLRNVSSKIVKHTYYSTHKYIPNQQHKVVKCYWIPLIIYMKTIYFRTKENKNLKIYA